jgi:hypothetical protein
VVEVGLHALLISALDGGQSGTTQPDSLTQRKNTDTCWMGSEMGSEPVLTLWENEKSIGPTGIGTPDIPARRLVTVLTSSRLQTD